MDQSAALLAALRAKASFGTNVLDAGQVEALAGVLGIVPQQLPALVAGLASEKHVELVWGGSLKVLPEAREPASGQSVVFNMPNAKFGDGATLAGRDATGGTVIRGAEIAQGQLAAVLMQLREVLPKLSGEAAHAATQTEQALIQIPPASPPEARQNWAQNALSWLRALVQAAPEVEQLASLGEKVVNNLT